MNGMRLSAALLLIAACGSDGGGGSDGAVASFTATGVVKSSSGSQSEMANWVLAFVERDTGIAQYAALGALGNYEIENVRLSLPQTVMLLDPYYRLAAVTSASSTTAESLHQYFTSSTAKLPSMVHQGPVIRFTESSGLTFTSDLISDTDLDGVPDGLTQLGLADTDSDGIDNTTDYDIDGDGVVNWFDADDDGDGVEDIFDSDANGDETVDSAQEIGELYFSTILKFISVQVVQVVQADSSLLTKLILTAKVNSGISIETLSVVGPSDLLDSAVATSTSAEGVVTTDAWDGTLLDDGFSEDGNSEDLLYARPVTLATGNSPKANQVLFFQVTDTSGTVWSFPYSFTTVSSSTVAGSYDTSTRVVTKSGTPFGSGQTYNWSVHIFDSEGTKVYASSPQSSAVNTYTIPSTAIDASQTYTARIIASTVDRIVSYPTWTVKSLSFSLN